jgi:hypothetical protein
MQWDLEIDPKELESIRKIFRISKEYRRGDKFLLY